jgi:hypothetical protein
VVNRAAEFGAERSSAQPSLFASVGTFGQGKPPVASGQWKPAQFDVARVLHWSIERHREAFPWRRSFAFVYQ